MTSWRGLWARPAIKGAVLGLLMVPLGWVVLELASLQFGLAGPVAYCALVPATGLASVLRASPPWDMPLVVIGNGGMVLGYAALIWLSLIAFSAGM